MPPDQLEERARVRLGSVLRGKYRIDRVLGVGGMAVVYKATHRNQAEFAIKMLHPELSLNEDIRTRFLREGYAANSVKHAGAVRVVDDDVADDGAAFLVMELLDGIPCDSLLACCGGRLPLDAACAIAVEVLDVLGTAHANGIVHRDVKPANLFLCRDGTLKVLDFGIARVRDTMTGGTHATGTGLLLGTPAFMSPEQALGKASEIDARADLWSVGATVFSLTSGEMVHDAETAPQLLVKLATEQARSLATVLPGAPPAVVSVVDRALALDKARRWPSAVEMRDALAWARHTSGSEAPTRAVIAGLVASYAPPPAAPAGGWSGAELPFQATPSGPQRYPSGGVPPASASPMPTPGHVPGVRPTPTPGMTPARVAPAATPVVETGRPVSQSHPAVPAGRSSGRAVVMVAALVVAAAAGGLGVFFYGARRNAVRSGASSGTGLAASVAPSASSLPAETAAAAASPHTTAPSAAPISPAESADGGSTELGAPQVAGNASSGKHAEPPRAPVSIAGRAAPAGRASPPPPATRAESAPAPPAIKPASAPPPTTAPPNVDPLDGRR